MLPNYKRFFFIFFIHLERCHLISKMKWSDNFSFILFLTVLLKHFKITFKASLYVTIYHTFYRIRKTVSSKMELINSKFILLIGSKWNRRFNRQDIIFQQIVKCKYKYDTLFNLISVFGSVPFSRSSLNFFFILICSDYCPGSFIVQIYYKIYGNAYENSSPSLLNFVSIFFIRGK